MGDKLGRGILGALLAVTLLLVGVSQATGATTYKSSQFSAQGTIVQPDVPVPPTVPGTVGGFVMTNEGASPAQVNGAQDGDGNLTIYYKADTGYHECDVNGENCHASTREQVLAAGVHVKVMGRFYVTNGEYSLVANDLWTPTKAAPPPAPPSGPNPQPSTLNDFTNGNLFSVRAKVVATTVDVPGAFKVGNFDTNNGYGCGAATTCKVKRIALAHADRLQIQPRGILTTYYKSTDGGCSYKKTDDSYDVVYRKGAVDGLRISGRYTWGSLDWVFTATNIWTPPPADPETCSNSVGGGLQVYSALTQQSPGTYTPGPDETWTGSEWSGTNGIGDFGAGDTVMHLDWVRVPGGYEFSGTYRVAAGPTSDTAIGGEINGIASPHDGDGTQSQWDISATLTVTETGGKYAGRTGDGTWRADGLGDWSTPPSAQQGTFRWHLSSP